MKLRLWLFYVLAYLKRPGWDTGVTPPELVELAEGLPPGRALDLGCGTGTNVIYLAQRGWKAAGVDFAPQAIWQARRKARAAGVQVDLLTGDVAHADLLAGREFDLVLDMGCLHSFGPAQQQAYRENLMRWLAPGGRFLLYGFLKPEEAPEEQRGLRPSNVEALEAMLTLERREVGEDRGRVSGWMWFRRAPRAEATS